MSPAQVQMTLLEAEVAQTVCEVGALTDNIRDLEQAVRGRDRLTLKAVHAEGLRKPRRPPYRRQGRQAFTLEEE